MKRLLQCLQAHWIISPDSERLREHGFCFDSVWLMPKYDRVCFFVLFMYKQLCSATCSPCISRSYISPSSSSLSDSRRYGASFSCVAINCKYCWMNRLREFSLLHSHVAPPMLHACCAFVIVDNFYFLLVVPFELLWIIFFWFVRFFDRIQIIWFCNIRAGNIVIGVDIVTRLSYIEAVSRHWEYNDKSKRA